MPLPNPLSNEPLHDEREPTLIMNSPAMQQVLLMCQKIAAVDSTVLLQGETGTGKSALARYIHSKSARKRYPFMAINCASIPENLLESELFGYLPGAFTGAMTRGKIGLIEAAHKGTLFLDEVGELPLHMQAKLLHVLQHQEFIPVGRLESRKVDVRFIAATNCDLREMVQARQFREDFFYRLNVIDVKVPPLRERREDVLPLIQHFLNKHNQRFGSSHQITEHALQRLHTYSWPGNIRQLENLLEKLIVTTDHLITDADLPEEIRHPSPVPANSSPSLDNALAEVEKHLVRESYQRLKSSRKVANDLQISQTKASRLIRKYCEDLEGGLDE